MLNVINKRGLIRQKVLTKRLIHYHSFNYNSDNKELDSSKKQGLFYKLMQYKSSIIIGSCVMTFISQGIDI